MAKIKDPVIGTTCPALVKENYDYMLSGDCYDYCRCLVNGTRCPGFYVDDPEDQSSRFFSRGKNIFDPEAIKKCPMYGMSRETFAAVIKDRSEKEVKEKMEHLGFKE